jgi:para-nitrobenzyl esterase
MFDQAMRAPSYLRAGLVALCAAIAGVLGGTASAEGARVQTQFGVVEGKSVQGGAVNAFMGLPYAAAPTGKLRWAPPVEPASWQGVRDATAFSAACMQVSAPPQGFYSDNPPRTSEDCLYLNVWAPKDAKNAPVMFWMHGGALIFGSGMNPRYDGAKLALKDVVVVSINYRLGVFGYFSHPELSAESGRNASGNYGTLDQIAALKWVRQNIGAFGGDPGNVTIFGQSAGALSVTQLMTSPLADGLFHRAIAQSAYIPPMPELKRSRFGLPPAEDLGLNFGKVIGAPSLADLRALPADRLLQAAALSFGRNGETVAVVDGWVQRAQVFETFESGREAKVPFIAGYTSGEATSYDPGQLPPFPVTPAEFETRANAMYADLAPEFLKRYPASTPLASSRAAHGEGYFGWGVEKLVRDHSRVVPQTWLYYFDHVYPAETEKGLGAFHSSDVPFVFGNVGAGAIAPRNWPTPPAGRKDIAMSDAMMDYWTAFARTGAPKAKGRPDWTPFDIQKRSYLSLNDGKTAVRDGLAPGMFDFHDRYFSRLRAAEKTPWGNDTIGIGAPGRGAP